eukprot:scaffold13389_cov134-Isochrysis_galbana.AAC.4
MRKIAERLEGATVNRKGEPPPKHLSSDFALRRLAQARATSDERGGTLVHGKSTRQPRRTMRGKPNIPQGQARVKRLKAPP